MDSNTNKIKGKSNLYFPTEYQEILERVHQIDPIDYARTRNFIDGSVTYLSPYISRGVISTKFILETVLQKGHSPNQIEKFIQELAWREYYQRIWQHRGDGIWQDLKQEQPDVVHHEMVESIVLAKTGIEAIDQAILQLYQSGYMHNHVRMYTAAMVCNMGKAHWKTPATWLYYHLLDGDIASNNCSWQWVSAAFSSKKYYFDQSNINKYTFSKQSFSFLAKSYEAIMEMPIPESLRELQSFKGQTILPETDLPQINTKLPTLIYNSYHLPVDWHQGEDVNRVLLLEPSHFNAYPVGEKVIQFILALSKNIPDLQIFTGEVDQISQLYVDQHASTNLIISKENPAFMHYPGVKEPRDWMFPEVKEYHSSFFSFWKKCAKNLY